MFSQVLTRNRAAQIRSMVDDLISISFGDAVPVKACSGIRSGGKTGTPRKLFR